MANRWTPSWALPESQVKQFIDRLGGKGSQAEEIEAAVASARAALDQGETDAAMAVFAQVLDFDPAHVGALAGLATAQIKLGDLEGAKETLAAVPAAKASDPQVLSAKALLELAATPVPTGESARLAAAVSQNPDDFQARVDLAIALNAEGKRDEAADHLLYVVRKKRDWNEEAARRQLVKFFEAWGPKDEATLAARRKLSAILFA
jgi:putative thioredoxin